MSLLDDFKTLDISTIIPKAEEMINNMGAKLEKNNNALAASLNKIKDLEKQLNHSSQVVTKSTSEVVYYKELCLRLKVCLGFLSLFCVMMLVLFCVYHQWYCSVSFVDKYPEPLSH